MIPSPAPKAASSAISRSVVTRIWAFGKAAVKEGGDAFCDAGAAGAAKPGANSANVARLDFLAGQNHVRRLAQRKPGAHVAGAQRIRWSGGHADQNLAFGVGKHAFRFRAAAIKTKEIGSLRPGRILLAFILTLLDSF